MSDADGTFEQATTEDALFLLCDQPFPPHVLTRKKNCDVLALLERAFAWQHGARHEEPSVPAVEEHPECRDHLNSSRDRHKVEIITSHGVPVVGASRSPRRIVKGSAERGPGGQAESPASRVVPLDGPVTILLIQTHQYGERFDRVRSSENGFDYVRKVAGNATGISLAQWVRAKRVKKTADGYQKVA